MAFLGNYAFWICKTLSSSRKDPADPRQESIETHARRRSSAQKPQPTTPSTNPSQATQGTGPGHLHTAFVSQDQPLREWESPPWECLGVTSGREGHSLSSQELPKGFSQTMLAGCGWPGVAGGEFRLSQDDGCIGLPSEGLAGKLVPHQKPERPEA